MATIGFIGLQNSHPFSDAEQLRSLNSGIGFGFLELDERRAAKFLKQFPESQRWESLADFVRAAPDVVVVTVRPPEVARIVEISLGAGIPTAVTKPAATNAYELAQLQAAVAGREKRFLSSSILRFAPPLLSLDGQATSGRVVAHHDIAYWAKPESMWQRLAGGLVPMMGIHAFELLEICLGPTLRVTEAHVVNKEADGSLTVVTGAASSEAGSMEFRIDGSKPGEKYGIEAKISGREVTVNLPHGPDGFGYRGFAKKILQMAAGGSSPVPWSTTRSVLQAVVDTRKILQL